MLQDGAIDREHDDQRRRYVDRNAEDTLQRDEQMADQSRNIVAAVCPGRRKIGSEIRVENEAYGDHGHDPAGSAPRRLQHQHDEDGTEDDVPFFRHRRAIGEFVALHERVDDGRDPDQRRNYVEPLDAVAEAIGDRKQQEAQ
jgi:hypothetical protein